MKDCGQVRPLLSRLIDGELDARERDAALAHVRGCEACREEMRRMESLRTEMKTVLAPPAVSESEWESVALRVVSRQGERFGFALLLPGLAALVAGTLVSFFTAPEIPLWVRVAFGLATAGATFLVVSALADRWQARRVERYERVER